MEEDKEESWLVAIRALGIFLGAHYNKNNCEIFI